MGRKLKVQKERVQNVKDENSRYRDTLEKALEWLKDSERSRTEVIIMIEDELKVRTLSGTLLPSR